MGIEGGTISSGGIAGVSAGIGSVGGGIGRGVSIGPSLGGGIGRGIGEGAVGGFGGSLASLGPKVEGLSLPIVSEGPARGFTSLPSLGFDLSRAVPPVFTNDVAVTGLKGGLEKGNTMPYKVVINNLGNYAIEPIRGIEISPAAEAISEAESILSETKARVVSPIPDVFQSAFSVNLDPDLKPAVENLTQFEDSLVPLVTPRPYTESRVSSRKAQSLLVLVAARVLSPIALENATVAIPAPEVNQAIIAQAEPENAIGTSVYISPQAHPITVETSQPEEEEIEQELEGVEEEKVEEPTDELEEEEVNKFKLKRVVDERALSQIIVEFKAGVKKAKEIAKSLGVKITGPLLATLLPDQHAGNESEDVKGKGLDGSIPERKEAIAAYGEFASEKDAEEKSVNEAYEKPPIKVREEGKAVTEEDVHRVHKHRVKPRATEIVLQIIKRRKLHKVGPQFTPQVKTEVVERRIEDDPKLAEVFQKKAA